MSGLQIQSDWDDDPSPRKDSDTLTEACFDVEVNKITKMCMCDLLVCWCWIGLGNDVLITIPQDLFDYAKLNESPTNRNLFCCRIDFEHAKYEFLNDGVVVRDELNSNHLDNVTASQHEGGRNPKLGRSKRMHQEPEINTSLGNFSGIDEVWHAVANLHGKLVNQEDIEESYWFGKKWLRLRMRRHTKRIKKELFWYKKKAFHHHITTSKRIQDEIVPVAFMKIIH